MTEKPEIYLASVLLEKNRWDSREPSFCVSDWSLRIDAAGYDGIELWENHVLLADGNEREAVLGGPAPVRVLNTYCSFDDEGADGRAASAELSRFLGVGAVKFNFGKDASRIQAYRDNLSQWRTELPAGCRLLCECHPGTVLEVPETAAELLRPVSGKVEVIVHALSEDPARELLPWLNAFGGSVTHVHVVLKDREHAIRRIAMLKDAGFSGTWTIEFCEGVNEPDETIEKLFTTAAADLDFLRTVLA
jgi:sugar phosphate isomerase/epimerase